MTKGISTLTGIIIIVVAIAIFFGGVFAWQYFVSQKVKGLPTASSTATRQQILNKQFPLAGESTDQTAGWKTYTNNRYGFELKYPQNLKVAESDDVFSRIIFSHSVPYKHSYPCDPKEDARQEDDLTDFYIWLAPMIHSSVDNAISDNSTPGHTLPKQKIKIGGFDGYKIIVAPEGKESCGTVYYYISLTPKRTLWMGVNGVPEFSELSTIDEINKYLALPGIINTTDSVALLNKIVSTIKIIK